MRKLSYLLAATVLSVLVAPGAADARYIVAGPGAALTTYAGVVFVDAGSGLEFVNADIEAHDVVSVDVRGPQHPPQGFCQNYGPGQCPLFRTDLVGLSAIVPVEGVEDLGTGLYPFYCTFHQNMQAFLVVI